MLQKLINWLKSKLFPKETKMNIAVETFASLRHGDILVREGDAPFTYTGQGEFQTPQNLINGFMNNTITKI